MKAKKTVTIIIAVIALIVLLIFIHSVFFTTAAPTYMTSKVKRGDIEVSVLANGTIKPHRLVAVGARATGRIISLKVKPGSVVKEGDLLAEIDPTTQTNDLKSKEAALANYRGKLAEQEAQLVLAKQNMTRQQTMISSHAVSKADFDDADAQVKIRAAQIDQLKAQIVQAEVDVETAKVNLGYTRVTAPSDGTVLATVVQEGQNVNAVQSAPTIVILGDLSVMTVRAEISEADVINVKPGQDLYFNVLGNRKRHYESRLEKIEPAPESIRNDISFNSSSTASSSSSTSQAIYYNGTFNVPNDDGVLRTYMTAEVHIILGRAQKVLLIPSDALNDVSGNKAVVNILDKNGKVEARDIETGLNNKVMVEVVSGLEEGETVVTGVSNGTMPSTSGSRHRVGPF
ncbi:MULTISPECIES: efflux RND transporter periplasmic adaptor subunit [Bartonella]|uniref:efflux RND transporter periplasmic adaptor subunit n=1 Tax=Bartonella TaxID=773 RepID=UPI0018DD755C|nr:MULTISPECIES: efflux RND transporter periplasmic adaptor subunit [Bartonella]MBH9974975.1 efflux RND transporter periplasmic adaptor subunit [Bartonella choladocola]MBI0014581.1 efflux RND transporter periplasmic adaptor subunit [Bartonella sp. B10834G3]MBI0139393.1 efflux RND transporter periplasmic adaptor subunit [Bartonella choladocola]